MGAFFINKNSENINKKDVLDFFLKKGHQNHISFNSDQYTFFVFEKIKTKTINKLDFNGNIIFSVGTFSYKGKNLKNSLNALSTDFLKDQIEYSALYGHYNIFILLSNNQVKILSDDKNSVEIYCNLSETIFSNSFLAIAELTQEKISVNKNAVLENLISGCLFGNDTIFNEIKVLNFKENKTFTPIIKPKLQIEKHKTFNDAIECQLQTLDSYFNAFKELISENLVDIGISGGYDSRLLLALTNKYYPKELQIHTHWKATDDLDIIIAKKIAEKVGKKLNSLPVASTRELSEIDFLDIVNSSMYFYDGLTRVNHGWTRKYRNPDYRLNILHNSNLGMSGLGGELFRNDFHIRFNKIDTSKWVKNYVIPIYLKNKLNKNTFNLTINNISLKIQNELCLENNKMSFLDTYRYYGEMWVKKGPGIRNGIENQLSYFLSPFTDSIIIQKSYANIPFIGISGEFEAKLIEKTNISLAEIISGYGFNFKNIPKKHLLKHTLLSYIPIDLKQELIRVYTRNKHVFPELNKYLINNHKFIRKDIKKVSDLNLGIELNNLLMYQDEFDRIIGIGHLLNHIERIKGYEIK
jgi:hypothetical protein